MWPAPSYLFLLVPWAQWEKLTQKKDTPFAGLPLVDSPALLARPGVVLELARSAARPRAQTIARRLPPARLRYSAARRGPKSVVVLLAMLYLESARCSMGCHMVYSQ